MKLIIRISLLIVVAVLLQACGSTNTGPAPVVENGRTISAPARPVEPVDQGEAQLTPLRRPPTVVARAQPNRAVAGLRKNAELQRRSGDYSSAVASLERALRISPRDADLWNRLARVRADQRRFAQVEDLAAKSNALSGGDRALMADNWQLIARARRALGDVKGAQQAIRKANDYYR